VDRDVKFTTLVFLSWSFDDTVGIEITLIFCYVTHCSDRIGLSRGAVVLQGCDMLDEYGAFM
jgi:hypothetical protein